MSNYTPDRWVMLEISTPSETIRKVLAGWSGSYTHGDSWKLNSGVTETRDMGDYYEFDGYSGSTYKCYKAAEGFNSIMAWIYDELCQKVSQDKSYSIKVIPYDN